MQRTRKASKIKCPSPSLQYSLKAREPPWGLQGQLWCQATGQVSPGWYKASNKLPPGLPPHPTPQPPPLLLSTDHWAEPAPTETSLLRSIFGNTTLQGSLLQAGSGRAGRKIPKISLPCREISKPRLPSCRDGQLSPPVLVITPWLEFSVKTSDSRPGTGCTFLGRKYTVT